MDRQGHEEAARAFVEKRFPECDLAILTGSTVRGEATPTSDLDIVIIDNAIAGCYRESFHEFGWPIETFVHTNESLVAWMDKDFARRRPSMPQMVAEGVLVRGSPARLEKLRAFAAGKLAQGPAPFTDAEDREERYFITDSLDDLIGSNNHDDDVFMVNALLPMVINYQLVKAGRWVTRGKRLRRALFALGEEKAAAYLAAMADFYARGNKAGLVKLFESALAEHGGRVFAGYSAGKQEA